MRRVAPAPVPASVPADERSERSRQLAELLSRTALGDRAAFARLYDETSAHLMGVVLRITRHRERAEDIVQEVYVNVWKSAGSFDQRLAQPLTWLTSVARNRAIDSLRRDQAQPLTVSTHVAGADDEDDRDLLQDLPSGDAGPLAQLEQAAEARALRGCLQQLGGETQQALALAFYQGQSYSEVADHLRQPLGTVKSWVRRGLQSLKGCLERASVQGL
ncbi:MAG: sigma-70 family RNA polymerase sigma factor [Rubrivivax sp.]|nr:sigma-70 family RNA polymerase sigma factor [Rubrivivax sp.]